MNRQRGRARCSWAAPQAGKASSRCLGFRTRESALRYPRSIDRTRFGGETKARGRRFPCSRGTACSEGPLATHPVPAGGVPGRGLPGGRLSIQWMASYTPRVAGPQITLCTCNCTRTGSRSASTHAESSAGDICPWTGE